MRALGYLLQERGVNNPYPRVYAAIWRTAGVGTTERILQAKFEEIMNWTEKQIRILTSAPRLSSEEDNLLGSIDSMSLAINYLVRATRVSVLKWPYF